MILTKSELCDEFGFNSLSSVSHLLKKGTIIANADGLIDLENAKNKKWAKKRRQDLKKKQEKPAAEQKSNKKKPEEQLSLEFDILSERLAEKRQKTKLLGLKVAKETKEVIETNVLNRIIINTFDSLFKNFAEFPNVCADEIIDIVRASENPREALIKFLTENILSNLKNSVDSARNISKRNYE